MAKATHTWKIGEYAKGGIITVEINGDKVAIIGKEWDHSAGTRRSSNQKNAQEFDRETVDVNFNGAERKAVDFLCDLTTSYDADKIMDWIKTKVKFNSPSFW